MEVWKDIPGFEGLYQASNFGQIRSVDHYVTCQDRWGNTVNKLFKGRVLKQQFDGKRRYLHVVLSKNGKTKPFNVHRLIISSFLGLPDCKEVNHIDGDKTNNKLDNLELVTRSENLQHALNIGLIENQCKIRRSVVVISNSGYIMDFPDMSSCCKLFGKTKCWLGNKMTKNGNPFRYGEYIIRVSERA